LQHKVVAILACLLRFLGNQRKSSKRGDFEKYAAVLFLGKDEKVKASFDQLAISSMTSRDWFLLYPTQPVNGLKRRQTRSM